MAMAWRTAPTLLVLAATSVRDLSVLGARITTRGDDSAAAEAKGEEWELVAEPAAESVEDEDEAEETKEEEQATEREEKRLDENYKYYTKQDFLDFWGDEAEAKWEASASREPTTRTTTTTGVAWSSWEIRKRISQLKKKHNVSDAKESEVAAQRVEDLPEFKSAKCVRVNPHFRELHVRLAALRAGKLLVVPTTGLRGLNVLDPAKIDPEQYEEAVTEAGVKQFGKPFDFKHNEVDLFVLGSMAVNPASGCRLGAFGGLDELEYEVLRELKVLKKDAPVITAVHDLELRDDIPNEYVSCFDLPADIVCTSTKTVRTETAAPKPAGLNVTKVQQMRYIGLLWDVKDKLEKSVGHSLTLAEEEFIPVAPEPETTTEPPLYEDDNWATSGWRIKGEIMKRFEEAGVNETTDFAVSAKHVVKLPEFKSAKVVRVHPHWRDYETRLATLKAGKTLVVPMAGFKDITVLDPAMIKRKEYAEAVTEAGLKKFGVPMNSIDSKLKIDLFVVASMAVNPSKGCRLGTHGGFEELEYQLLRQLKLIDKSAPVVTSIHDLEIVSELPSETVACEILPVDIVCTNTITIRPAAVPAKPRGLILDKLIPKQLGASDIIKRLRPRLEKELGATLPIEEVQPLLPGEREGYGRRKGKGGKKKAAAEEEAPTARSGKGGRQQLATIEEEPATRSGKGGRQPVAEEPAPAARSGKGGKQAEVVEEPVVRSGKGGRQPVAEEPAPVVRSGKGGKQVVEEEPVVRSGKGGRQPVAEEPAPAARSGKGGRQAEVVEEPAPVARSGKGGRAPVAEEPPVAARSGKGGRQAEAEAQPAATRSGKGGREQPEVVQEAAAPAPRPRRRNVRRRPTGSA